MAEGAGRGRQGYRMAAGLVVEEVDGEFLVCDADRAVVHRVGGASGEVLRRVLVAGGAQVVLEGDDVVSGLQDVGVLVAADAAVGGVSRRSFVGAAAVGAFGVVTLALPRAAAASSAAGPDVGGASASGGTVYGIGDTGPGGGIVFFVSSGGLNGLEAAPEGWNGTNDPTRTWDEAITLSNSYETTVGGVTYDDWFLPSSDQLNTLFEQKDVVGGFASSVYWSSSENPEDASQALRQNFVTGGSGFGRKTDTWRVRPIRAF